jgi:hypothetical protein
LLVAGEATVPSAFPHQEFLDVGAFEMAQRCDVGMVGGEEFPKGTSPDEALDRACERSAERVLTQAFTTRRISGAVTASIRSTMLTDGA